MKELIQFMVIDDEPVNNIICEAMLRRVFGDIVVKSFNVAELAMSYISQEYGPSHSGVRTVLFLDINMPTMTGWEFLEEFKLLDQHIQKQFTIYILSSSVDQRDKDRASVNSLVSGFVCKPLNKESIHKIFHSP